MAVKELVITLTWENDVNFTMKSKLGTETPITIIKTDENTHFGDTWKDIASVCKIYFDKELKIIGDEMMS